MIVLIRRACRAVLALALLSGCSQRSLRAPVSTVGPSGSSGPVAEANAGTSQNVPMEAGTEPEEKPDLDADLDDAEQQADTALERGDVSRAKQLAEHVIQVDPEGHPYAYVILGDIARKASQLTVALGLYQRAMSLDPNDAWAVTEAATTLEQMSQKQQARELLRRFLASHPHGDVDALDALGWLELDRGAVAEAKLAFDGAVRESRGEDPDAWYGLAVIGADLGNISATSNALQHLLSIDPKRRTEIQTDAAFDDVRKDSKLHAFFGHRQDVERPNSAPKPR